MNAGFSVFGIFRLMDSILILILSSIIVAGLITNIVNNFTNFTMLAKYC